jgi:hypothetical protein
MWLDLVAMIPDIPSNFPEFHDERGGPTFASVLSAEPDEVSFLNACPFDGDAAFKECMPPETVLGVNSFEQARKIETGGGMGLGATSFGETMDNPKDNLWSGTNRLEPRPERGHEKGPNEEDSGFLTEPNMTSILAVAAARASRGGPRCVWLSRGGGPWGDDGGRLCRRPNQYVVSDKRGSCDGMHASEAGLHGGRDRRTWTMDAKTVCSCPAKLGSPHRRWDRRWEQSGNGLSRRFLLGHPCAHSVEPSRRAQRQRRCLDDR